MWRRYVRFWRPDPDQDIQDELDFHFDARITELTSQGIPLDQAHWRAREEFGDVEAVRGRLAMIDRQLEARRERAQWLDAARQDVLFAFRSVRRHSGYVSVLVLTLAIGVTAAGSMFGLMWRLLIQPAPHVVEPQRLAQLFIQYGGSGDVGRHVNRWSYRIIDRLRMDAPSLATVGAYLPMDATLGVGLDARSVRAVMASGDYWRALGVRPRLGRFFSEVESHPATGSPVVVLSHAFWQDYFGGDDVTGRKVTIRGAPFEVIGVAPRGFRGIELEQVDVWLPLLARTEPGSRAPWYSAPFNDELRLIARLAAEATPAGAAREVTTIMRPFFTDLNREAGFTIHRDSLNASMAPITSKLGRGAEGTPESRVVDWLVAVGIILLLVAVSNVAGLLLLRSMGRGREVAIRSALGMTRGRLAALVLTETFILVVMGGVAGLALLLTAGRSLERMVFPGLAWEAAATLEPTRVAVVATGVLLAFVLAGLVALAHTPRDVAAVLKQGAQRAATRRSPAHRLILVAQTTLSFILLVGAALFVRSLRNLTSEDLGVDAHRTLAVHVDFAGTARSRAEIGAFYERARERVAAIPGIESTSLSLSAPLLRSARSGGSIRLPGVDSVIRMPGIGTIPMVNYVTPDFFETVGMSLQRGRTFEESEREHGLAVVVNRTMADVYWPGQEAVGECVQLNRQPACATVVGVVEPQRMFQIREEPHLLYYRPLPRTDAEIGNLLLRTSLSSARTAMTVRRALLDVDPGLPWADISELSTGLEAELRPWRLGVTVFTAFGGLAMLLAAIGLTSAIAYSVNERAREISVRVAVGARRWDVLLLVLREGLAIGVLGVGVGLAVALIAAPRLGDLLYKQAPHDVFVLGTVAVAVLAIAILAALAPAIRASRIDPMRVLTSD